MFCFASRIDREVEGSHTGRLCTFINPTNREPLPLYSSFTNFHAVRFRFWTWHHKLPGVGQVPLLDLTSQTSPHRQSFLFTLMRQPMVACQRYGVKLSQVGRNASEAVKW